MTILWALVSIFEFRFRSRASLELEFVALRHQATDLRRQHPGRPQLSSLDRLLWVWLYRIWPQVIDAMVLSVAATQVSTSSFFSSSKAVFSCSIVSLHSRIDFSSPRRSV